MLYRPRRRDFTPIPIKGDNDDDHEKDHPLYDCPENADGDSSGGRFFQPGIGN
jgi:hypothetical protein